MCKVTRYSAAGDILAVVTQTDRLSEVIASSLLCAEGNACVCYVCAI